MARDIVDELYFHINSYANNSPHDLMRLNSVIQIGAKSNPFFGFYENFQRTYPVTHPNAPPEQVPAIEFLRRVKDGQVKPNNLPFDAWTIARHFMMLARELIWENVRLAEFPQEPSRQRCVWLIEDEQRTREWIKTIGCQPMTYSVIKVRATGRALPADSRHLAGESEPLPVWYDRARRYWRGEMTSNPLREVLFEGTLMVEEILAMADWQPAP
jgi:hypothetical protein